MQEANKQEIKDLEKKYATIVSEFQETNRSEVKKANDELAV
jgi:hypothetical protein